MIEILLTINLRVEKVLFLLLRYAKKIAKLITKQKLAKILGGILKRIYWHLLFNFPLMYTFKKLTLKLSKPGTMVLCCLPQHPPHL